MAKLTQQQLEAYLWGAANILRGRTAGQDYKTYILSLLFFKRLSDQWDHEAEERIAELEKQAGKTFSDKQRGALRASKDIHRFTIPEECHWADVFRVSENIGQKLTEAMRGIQAANKELAGVFTVDWNQPAPDGKGRLIPNEVVSALIQHFNGRNLSNANVQPDVLGGAYEYLIKQFADDAGAKAGEFFTPPEVVDVLVRVLKPQPGETVYDPTCGSGGMLVHAADYLRETGHRADDLRYYGQEMNWSTYAIARINVILHGMEAEIVGGRSTITDPGFTDERGGVRRFNLVLANFPFSDETWWLSSEQQTEEQIKKAKKAFREQGFKDRYSRFVFGTPPASYGDYAFIQHILASTTEKGRAGVVCPQGVLFRGQPEIEEETGESNGDGTPKVRRRKADDEYLIRKGLLDAHLVDAVIALPLNVFYGAGVPACLLILRKDRPQERREKLLLVYAARHYRELSNKNQLRPQDVMRILVHYHAYGDSDRAKEQVKLHSARSLKLIAEQEEDETGLIAAEYEETAANLARLESEGLNGTKPEQNRRVKAMEKLRQKVAECDQRIAEVRKQMAEDRKEIEEVGHELVAMYTDPAELARHARLVGFEELLENEYNLNIPRYVDTFEPEEAINVNAVLGELDGAESQRQKAEAELLRLLKGIGYGA